MTDGDAGPGRSVAFLRGINLGKRSATKQQLVAAVSGCGLTAVDTFLASGNVLFTWPVEATAPEVDGAAWATDRTALEAHLGRALQAELGYEVPVTVRTGAQLRALAGAHPFDEDQLRASGGKPQVILLFQTPGSGALAAAEALSTEDDLLVADCGELFWLPSRGVGRSGLDMKAMGKALDGVTVTVRTVNTINRLVAKL